MSRIRGTAPTVDPEAPEAAPEIAPPAWPILTEEEKDEAKRRFPGTRLFRVQNCGQTYLIRPLSSNEWSALTRRIVTESRKGTLDASRSDEWIASEGIVWPVIPPENRVAFWQGTLAGAARTIALQVRQKSGFPLVTDDGRIVADSLEVLPLFDTESEERPTSEEPTGEALEALRAGSPNGTILRTEFPGGLGVHYLRPWTRPDWEAIQVQEERGNDFRDFAVRRALLWSSEDWTKPALAGVIEQLFGEAMVVSGFTAAPEVEEI